MKPRYVTIVWHSKLFHFAAVMDTKRNRPSGIYSSYRDGLAWHDLADVQCAALNRARTPFQFKAREK
jgi:hypothetical protein